MNELLEGMSEELQAKIKAYYTEKHLQEDEEE